MLHRKYNLRHKCARLCSENNGDDIIIAATEAVDPRLPVCNLSEYFVTSQVLIAATRSFDLKEKTRRSLKQHQRSFVSLKRKHHVTRSRVGNVGRTRSLRDPVCCERVDNHFRLVAA